MTVALRRERAGKYLTFFLAGEEYGLEILTVSEIIGMQAITRVPRTPEYVRGVINLRGKVIPITDLRIKFAMPAGTSEESCIIVVQVRDVQTGIVVDRVSEVVALADADIADAPEFGAGVQTDLLLGIGKTGSSVKLLLDIDKVLAAHEIAALTVATLTDTAFADAAFADAAFAPSANGLAAGATAAGATAAGATASGAFGA